MIPDFVLIIVVGLLSLTILLSVVRIFLGPTPGNSAAAGDLVFFAFVGLVAILGIQLQIDSVMDIILIAALLGFLSVLSLARLMQGGKR